MTGPEQARESAGLSVEQAAARARIAFSYLRRIERQGGGAPFVLAQRLSRLYGCPLDTFLSRKEARKRTDPLLDSPAGRRHTVRP